jgi:hypothetical protein
MPELSYFNRLEPRPRDNDFTQTLAAEVRDPLWFLARQWQVGEFNAEDAGSLAYVSYSGRTTKVPRWRTLGGSDATLDQEAPLERQTLNEPFEPDFATQVELGHDFADFLREEVDNATVAEGLLVEFGNLALFQVNELPDPDENVLDPVDPATKRFLKVCAGRTLNGFELLELGRAIEAGTGEVPPEVTTDATEIAQIEAALARLVERAEAVYGDVGTADPVAWRPQRLEYRLEVVAEDPAGQGNVTLDAYPDSGGEYDWYSFDLVGRNTSATEEAPTPRAASIMPARVRFTGMPISRFWAFEENTLALPDIEAGGTDDLLKLLVSDFMLIHSNDWFVVPFEQKAGTLAQIDWILVHDVFGSQVVVLRADLAESKGGTNRWTMFSNTDRSSSSDAIADFFFLPPTPGATMQLGTVLEDVRFGRDETANLAFAIERTTTSLIGEPRSGRQRDADVEAARKLDPRPPSESDFPLRYQVGSELPANWVPLLPRLENPSADPPDPSIVLQRGQAEKATGAGTAGPVPALSKILKPEGLDDYVIQEEEIPRAGLKVERVVFRSRWSDGSTHLWVQRRRAIGAGESQSGLQFDQARLNDG